MKKIYLAMIGSLTVFMAVAQTGDKEMVLPVTKMERAKSPESIPQTLQEEKVKILQVAESSFMPIITGIPEHLLLNYGFADFDEVKRSGFGDPVMVYTIQDKELVFTNTWRLPVVLNQEFRALLTIVLTDGEYKVVDFGAHGLARELFVRKTEQTTGMLRVYELKMDYFIEGTAKAHLQFIPVFFEDRKSYELNDIIRQIQNISNTP